MTIHFIIPGDPEQQTGGYIYNLKIIEGLSARGYKVLVHNPGNDFPFPGERSLQRSAAIFSRIAPAEPVIIDSLALGPMEEIIQDHKGRKPMISLVHLPLFMNPVFSDRQKAVFRKKEESALREMIMNIAVSAHTKEIIMNSGIDGSLIKVVRPTAEGNDRKRRYPAVPEKLLCIANYTRNKGFHTLLEALGGVREKPWTLECYGNKKMGAGYVPELEEMIKRGKLDERIFLNDSLPHEALSDVYLSADLFILPSEYESYPMVLAEALVHGIPVIAAGAGGIGELVPEGAGMLFKPGSSESLTEVVNQVLTDHKIYSNMCSAASKAFEFFSPWQNKVDIFEQELQSVISEFQP